MIPSFFHLFRPKADGDSPIAAVEVHAPIKRNPAVERILVLGWVLIALKCAFVTWAWRSFELPFHPLWLIGPSLAFGALCTLVYWLRVRK